jgi:type 2 lantibiotic biosynthesis protein LanM
MSERAMNECGPGCVLGDPRWWAGIPSTERGSGPARLTPAERDRGALRHRGWREGIMVAGVPVTLSPDEERLAGEFAESLRDRLPDPPDWLNVIHTAWSACGDPDEPAAHECFCGGDRRATTGLTGDVAFTAWIDPLLRWARHDLRDRILASAAESLPTDHPLLRADLAHLTGMIKRVLVLELNVARERGRLCGATPRDRFACFARGLRRPAVALDLLAEYPVLARELVVHLRQWADSRAEFAARMRADWPDLVGTFGLDERLGREVRDIEDGVADRHRGGRGVVIVHLTSGTVVYKPRPVGPEKHFADLVSWMNDRGLAPALRGLTVLDRGDYGWCSYVAHEPCADDGALVRFHRRQGAQLALLYALRAYDIHMFNVVASGEHPVVVDLETVFHTPGVAGDDEEAGDGAVGQALRESVLATLLLPQPAADLSALTGGRGTAPPRRRQGVAFEDVDTDRMRVVRHAEPLPPSRNLPAEPDVAVPVDAVVAGFRDCYRLLLDERSALLDDDGPVAAFGADRVRVVLRDTATYRTLLTESWHPDLLRDGLDRDLFLSLLQRRGRVAVDPAALRSERRQLAGQDVPTFDIGVADTTLHDPAGVVRRGLVTADGLACVRRRIAGLSEEDMAAQEWFIRASLVNVCGPGEPAPFVPPDASGAGGSAVLADAAIRIAERLRATALGGDAGDGPEWLSLNRSGDRYTIEPAGLGLASGVIGILVFLTELEVALGETRYRPLADGLLESLLDPDGVPDPEDLAEFSIGGYEDLGAMLILIVRLHELRGESALLDTLKWLLPVIERNMLGDVPGDVITGLSGAALALLRMRHIRPVSDAVLSDLGTRIERAARRERPGAGFGTGLSGYAYALAALGQATGEEQLLAAARRVLRDERGLLRAGTRLGWADGLAGTLLARSAMLELASCAEWEPELRADIDLVTALIRSHRAVHDDSLGHGRLGAAEALCHAADLTKDEELRELAGEAVTGIARRVLAGQARTALPGGVWSPALLSGGTGIGYGLLAACSPVVPSLLLIDTRPNER